MYHDAPPPTTIYVPIVFDRMLTPATGFYDPEIHWDKALPTAAAAAAWAAEWLDPDDDLLICRVDVTFVPVKEILSERTKAEVADDVEPDDMPLFSEAS